MDKLILENVRCFRDRHEIRIAPLTLIVGENSSGKSTLLAAARLASELRRGVLQPDFNEDPFDWGAYDQIAHYAGGRRGRAREFSLGLEWVWRQRKGKGDALCRPQLEVTFVPKVAQPQVREWQVHAGRVSMTIEYEPGLGAANVVVGVGQHREKFHLDNIPRSDYFFHIYYVATRKGDRFSKEEVNELTEFRSEFFSPVSMPYAIAPIRTKPRRTYDRRSEVPQPEGGHVPMILAALKSSNPKDWQELKESLREFGVESGLFKSIDIKRLGSKDSDPFQVRIKALGPAANLVDVGYGVSQILPVAVDCLTAERGQTLLMQQPEVHLHPRAQAELGSFLGYMVKRRRNRFMIETHSDYLIDRVRLDIRDGKNLRPKDVSLLYCERNKIGVKVHQIEIDSRGNLVNPPTGYRSFFLEEEKRFFGE